MNDRRGPWYLLTGLIDWHRPGSGVCLDYPTGAVYQYLPIDLARRL